MHLHSISHPCAARTSLQDATCPSGQQMLAVIQLRRSTIECVTQACGPCGTVHESLRASPIITRKTKKRSVATVSIELAFIHTTHVNVAFSGARKWSISSGDLHERAIHRRHVRLSAVAQRPTPTPRNVSSPSIIHGQGCCARTQIRATSLKLTVHCAPLCVIGWPEIWVANRPNSGMSRPNNTHVPSASPASVASMTKRLRSGRSERRSGLSASTLNCNAVTTRSIARVQREATGNSPTRSEASSHGIRLDA